MNFSFTKIISISARIRQIIFVFTLFSGLLFVISCRDPIKEMDHDFLIFNTGAVNEEPFTIYHPYDGFEVKPGETLVIQWQSRSNIERVDIFLYRKATQKLAIADNEKNSGKYAWQIPTDLPWSLHYSLKIQNHFNNEEFNFSDRFSIIVR